MPYLAGLEAGNQRVANLEALHQRALRFSGYSKQGLHRFLRFIEKLRDQDGDFGEAPVLSEASNVVRIMSVHKSKGLEFPVVIVAGLGGKLNLPEGGAVKVHRDLGIGLKVADVERNIFYPSAASACIVEAERRSARAEELRLLYVAMTRARDHLILTGHANKEVKVAAVRELWRGHVGPLPEDELLNGRTFFDWLLPAIASGGLTTHWDDREATTPQVQVALHRPGGSTAAAAAPSDVSPQDQNDNWIQRLIDGQPLAEPCAVDAGLDRLITRVTGEYPFEAMTHAPAVRTVSELKSLAEDEDAPPVRLFTSRSTGGLGAEAAKTRGTSTHRVLELLDLAHCATAKEIAGQIAEMVEKKRILADEATAADVEGILWAMHSDAGARIIRAAERIAKKEPDVHLRREIPFTWSAPISEADRGANPADWPTIRGTIDLLIVDSAIKHAEIIDYKTESSETWQRNLPAYETQMRYYLRAASDILGFPVPRATLLFLSPRVAHEVTLSDQASA